MAKARLGSGARFAALENKLSAKGVRNPGALAAFIGRKKLGKKKFNKLSAIGARRAARKTHPNNTHTNKSTGPHGGNKPMRSSGSRTVHPHKMGH